MPPDAIVPAAAPAPPSRKKRRGVRPHPYADEVSTPREKALDASRVTLFWAGLAVAIAAAGWFLSNRYSPYVLTGSNLAGALSPDWDIWTQVPLFAGLGLLGFGFVARNWARNLVMAGWVLFAFYWALTAQDLFVKEGGDYVNMAFAYVGVFFFTYLAYHQWLNEIRGVENGTVRFLNVATFIAAGSYFIIDKIQPIRTWLILTVSDHTRDMLRFFGQGESKGLVYLQDLKNLENPTYFFYKEWFCDPNHIDPGIGKTEVAAYCADGARNGVRDNYLHLTQPDVSGFWDSVFHFDPTMSDPTIIPVSVILACTALQSIMLFVGLFVAVPATWKKRLWASAIVAVIVYFLNLLRNTGIIWWYGEGVTSFWVVHDVIGKGGSLVAMIAIAFGAFRWFPEFLKSLIGVLDLPHRDGPVERTLKLGRRRPEPPVPPAATPADVAPPVPPNP